MEKINGQRIVRLRTLGSQYDKGRLIEAIDDKGTTYRMEIGEFMKVIGRMHFDVTPGKKFPHLTLTGW